MPSPQRLSEVVGAMAATSNRGIHFVDAAGCRYLPYDEIFARVAAEAERLSAAGVTAGDRCVICMGSSIDAVVRFFALLWLEAIPVSIKPRNEAYGDYSSYLTGVVQQQGARVLVGLDPTALPTRPDSKPLSRDEARDCDLALVQYTSGSTSHPKAIELSHASILHNVREIARFDGRNDADVGWNIIPLCHDMGLVGGFLSNFVTFNTVVLVDTSWFLRNPAALLQHAHELGATKAPLPNYIVRYLTRVLARRSDPKPWLATFDTLYIGSELISQSLVDEFLSVAKRWGLAPQALVFAYGMAEAVLMVTAHRYRAERPSFDDRGGCPAVANNGRPIGGVDVRIAGGMDAAVGEVEIRGASLCRPTSGQIWREGWLATGDLGYHKDGNLYLLGRMRDSFIVDGVNVHAVDIENRLKAALGVGECVVHHHDGTLYVLLVNGGTTDVDHARTLVALEFGVKRAAFAAIPARALVRTTSGKVIKGATIARYQQMIRKVAPPGVAPARSTAHHAL